MSSVVQKLASLKAKPINPPSWLPMNICYEVIMGSRAYGVNATDKSDFDMYGVCIPPKTMLFPHLRGEIPGFGKCQKPFEQWQQAHINVGEAEYDFQIYNIVKYFQLCLENNPNMIDSLFVPDNCVVHCTSVGNIIRDNRRSFLSQLVWKKFKGYAYRQMHKLDNKEPIGKRKELVDEYGFDTKYAYHIFRLMNEAQQILQEGDLDLLRSREELKSIRRGEWTEERFKKEFVSRIGILEEVHAKSNLRQEPDEQYIRQILLNCLEEHYGSLDGALAQPDAAIIALRNINEELRRVEHLIYETPTAKSEESA